MELIFTDCATFGKVENFTYLCKLTACGSKPSGVIWQLVTRDSDVVTGAIDVVTRGF